MGRENNLPGMLKLHIAVFLAIAVSIASGHMASADDSATGIMTDAYGQTEAGSMSDMTDADVVLSPDIYSYDGSAKTPDVSVALNGIQLVRGTDFSVEYKDNTDAGSGSVIISGTGNYTGTISSVFTINAVDIGSCTVRPIAVQVYTGGELRPGVDIRYGSKILAAGTDYHASYSNNIEVGIASVTITGKGNFTGELVLNFTIGTVGADKSGAAGILPAVGTVVGDTASNAQYKVTKTGDPGTAEVAYVAPLRKNSATASIPKMVAVNGVACKVTSIAANAFKNNRKLKKVTIGSYVAAIGRDAFYGCTKLTSVTLGANVTAIKAGAFRKCTALTKITIPAKVKRIGEYAFYGCKKLKTITIKTRMLTAKTVGSKAFGGTNSKAAFKVPAAKQAKYKKLLQARGAGKKASIKKISK